MNRTQSLLDRLPKDQPLTPTMRNAMIAALAAAEQFASHKSALASDGRMTPKGKQLALMEALTQNHGKAWARAKAPVAKARAEIKARRAALTIKAVDPQNITAALERQEIRSWLRTLDLGARQGVVLGTNDCRILEAMVTAPPELSGVVAAELAGKVEERYLELTYGDELASIEAADAVVAEAEAAMHVSRNELRSTVNVDMHPRDFDELMKPVEAAELKSAAPSETQAPTSEAKTTPDDSKPAAPMFSPDEYKELWRPFDELVAGIAGRGAV